MEPQIFPPIQPDEPGKGKPSDHSTQVAQPYMDTSKPKQAQTEIIVDLFQNLVSELLANGWQQRLLTRLKVWKILQKRLKC